MLRQLQAAARLQQSVIFELWNHGADEVFVKGALLVWYLTASAFDLGCSSLLTSPVQRAAMAWESVLVFHGCRLDDQREALLDAFLIAWHGQ